MSIQFNFSYSNFISNTFKPTVTFPFDKDELKDPSKVLEVLGIEDYPEAYQKFVVSFTSACCSTPLCFEAKDPNATSNVITDPKVTQKSAAGKAKKSSQVPMQDPSLSSSSSSLSSSSSSSSSRASSGTIIIDINYLLGVDDVDATAGAGAAYDLAICHRHRKLTKDNIKGYFESIEWSGTMPAVMMQIEYFSKHVKISDEEIGKRGANFSFVKYHTSFSSTHGLVRKFLDEVPQAVILWLEKEGMMSNFSEINAQMEMLDRSRGALNVLNNLDKRCILQTYCYLKTVKQLPENWFTGERVYNDSPAFVVKRLLAFYSRLVTLMAKVPDTDDVDSLAKLLSAFESSKEVKGNKMKMKREKVESSDEEIE